MNTQAVNVGDICIYSYDDRDNKSLTVVKIIELLSEEIASVIFLDVLIDDSGNDLFNYLLESGKPMNVSLKYLKKCHGDFVPYK